STHEELVASNEELQSTNEELHSVNEELYTVNAEHQEKIAELLQMTNDMNNMLKSTEIGTVFLDRDLRIRKFTPAAADSVNLLPQDIGRPIAHISNNLGRTKLIDDVTKVAKTHSVIERKVMNKKGRHFLMRILPYRNEVNKTDGVVIAFIDISNLHIVEENLRKAHGQLEQHVQARTRELKLSEERLEMAIKSGKTGIWDWPDIHKAQQWWSPSFYRILGYEQNQLKSTFSNFKNLIHPEDRENALKVLFPLQGQSKAFNIEFRVRLKDGRYCWVNMRGQRMRTTDKAVRMMGTIVDVHQRKLMENTLIESERKFRRVFETSTAGKILFDEDMRIIMHNDMASNIFGYGKKELLKLTLNDLIPDAFRHTHQKLVKQYQKNPKDRPMGHGMELFGRLKNGKTIPLEIALTKIEEEDGVKVLASIADITMRKQLYDLLKQHQSELERSNNDLEQFAYVASHDLQEPLRMIYSFNQRLHDKYGPQLDDKAREYIDFSLNGAKRMTALITDLLEYSRIGRMDAQRSRVDLNKVINEIKDDLKVVCQEKNATIRVEKLPVLFTSKVRMRQLFQNLIVNGIKFNDKKKPEITISCVKKESYYEFTVRDNGIGIPVKYQERVFSIFQRLHRQKKYSGTGIGLAICKKIVEHHGGRIHIQSNKKQGTSFCFTLSNMQNKS
ncbi:MAG: PAS domain S-box protein, partial [Candidatus Omnitrophica bacterium]|nr:PAS domain S-box protein [Candidatus Omnitrophota bacterium]